MNVRRRMVLQIPQGLKPAVHSDLFGTTEAVP